MSAPLHALKAHAGDFWLARGAVVIVAALQFFTSAKVVVGPRLLAPGLEIALLIPLSVASAWTRWRETRPNEPE